MSVDILSCHTLLNVQQFVRGGRWCPVTRQNFQHSPLGANHPLPTCVPAWSIASNRILLVMTIVENLVV
jgi:hypothetical protein